MLLVGSVVSVASLLRLGTIDVSAKVPVDVYCILPYSVVVELDGNKVGESIGRNSFLVQ